MKNIDHNPFFDVDFFGSSSSFSILIFGLTPISSFKIVGSTPTESSFLDAKSVFVIKLDGTENVNFFSKLIQASLHT